MRARELGPLSGPNNTFGTATRVRFGAAPVAIMEPGVFDSVSEYLDPDRPLIGVIDSRLRDSLATPPELSADVIIEVSKEPTFASAEAAFRQCTHLSDANILAVGGGSTMDVAKALRAFRTFGLEFQLGYGDMRRRADFDRPRDWLAVVPTLPGSGAESSRYVVLKNDEGAKVPARAWCLQPDIALLDSTLLNDLPADLLLAGAFDAFVHGWETLITKGESSNWSRAVSRRVVDLAIGGVRGVLKDKTSLPAIHALMEASYLGGLSVSNVRVGILHTAGEALAAHHNISHPESLLVFAQGVRSLYACAKLEPDLLDLWDSSISLWQAQFQQLQPIIDTEATTAYVLRRLYDDTTLLTKTHPGPTSTALLRHFVEMSLDLAGRIDK